MNPIGDDIETFLEMLLPKPVPLKPSLTQLEEDEGGTVEHFLENMRPKRLFPPLGDREGWRALILDEVPKANLDVVEDLLDRACVEYLEAVLDRRLVRMAKAVRDLLFEHGSVTTQQVRAIPYDPVAIFELTRMGVTLSSEPYRGSGGSGTLYRWSPETFVRRLGKRRPLTKGEKRELFARTDGICPLCRERPCKEADHRTPYGIVENDLHTSEGLGAFQGTCSSCNTEKDKECRACSNFTVERDPSICLRCRWAYPEGYDHIAMERRRKLILVATTDESIEQLVKLESAAKKHGLL
jgi:hypothetical protein